MPLAGLVLLAALLSGCVGEPDPVETTPLFASEDEAFAAAEQTYRAYVDALNEVDLSDPATFEPVFAFSTGELNAADRESFSTWHADGLTVVGDSRVALVEGTNVDENEERVVISVCLDVSGVEVRDAEGNSVVDSARSPIQPLEVSLVPSRADGSMKLTSITSRESGPVCQ